MNATFHHVTTAMIIYFQVKKGMTKNEIKEKTLLVSD